MEVGTSTQGPFTRINDDGSYDYGVRNGDEDRVLGQAPTQADAYRALLTALQKMRQTYVLFGMAAIVSGADLIAYSLFGLGTGLERWSLLISAAASCYLTYLAVRTVVDRR